MPEQYISTTETGQKWGITGRRAATLCKEGRIPGSMLVGRTWMVPDDAVKPGDARIKSGRYIKAKHDEGEIEK